MLTYFFKVFIRPLRNADPPVIRSGVCRLIDEVFGNILDLRECSNHLLVTMYVRQREQGGIISRIGDIFLNVAADLRLAYLKYIGQLAAAERRLKDEIERSGEFRVFLEVCARLSWMCYRPLETDPAVSFLKQCLRHPTNVHKTGLRHWLNRPSEHLQMYPVVFEEILEETAVGDPDVDLLKEVVEAMRNLQGEAQLKTFQTAMGMRPTGKFEWHNFVELPPTPSEYVIAEEPNISGQLTPLRPPRPFRPPPPCPPRSPHTRPPPPAPSSDAPVNMTMSQRELPPIPSSSPDTETSVTDLSAFSWSESFDTEETSQEETPELSSKESRQSAGRMTADQLMTVWGRVGIQVCEVAVQLFEKSKEKLIGDGTYIGFVNAVLDVVPNASVVEEDASSFGYLIYVQTGSSVTKRASDIMAGDIVMLQDAKLKGYKGIKTYNQTVGRGIPVVAVVGEYEPGRFKLKAYQAGRHAGHQVRRPIDPASGILIHLFRPSRPSVIG